MAAFLVVLLLAIGVIFTVVIYNRMVALQHRYKNAFAQIDVQLQRRYDLIPNLVEATKGYLQHEKDTLTQVVNARQQAINARELALSHLNDNHAISRLGTAEGQLSNTLGKLLAIVENYPDLKADSSIAQLMEALSSTENRIGFARQRYNDAVMQFNIYRQQFPNNLIIQLFGQFLPAHALQLAHQRSRQGVSVQL